MCAKQKNYYSNSCLRIPHNSKIYINNLFILINILHYVQIESIVLVDICRADVVY